MPGGGNSAGRSRLYAAYTARLPAGSQRPEKGIGDGGSDVPPGLGIRRIPCRILTDPGNGGAGRKGAHFRAAAQPPAAPGRVRRRAQFQTGRFRLCLPVPRRKGGNAAGGASGRRFLARENIPFSISAAAPGRCLRYHTGQSEKRPHSAELPAGGGFPAAGKPGNVTRPAEKNRRACFDKSAE